MDVFLWIIQVFLAAIFLTLGLAKAVVPMDKLQKAMEWTRYLPEKQTRAIGILESAGGFGLFFPGLYPITPLIIPISASGLALIMALAAAWHLRRGEKSDLLTNVALFTLAAFVAISRFIMYPGA